MSQKEQLMVTYLNSGNVVFSSTTYDTDDLAAIIQAMIRGRFLRGFFVSEIMLCLSYDK